METHQAGWDSQPYTQRKQMYTVMLIDDLTGTYVAPVVYGSRAPKGHPTFKCLADAEDAFNDIRRLHPKVLYGIVNLDDVTEPVMVPSTKIKAEYEVS